MSLMREKTLFAGVNVDLWVYYYKDVVWYNSDEVMAFLKSKPGALEEYVSPKNLVEVNLSMVYAPNGRPEMPLKTNTMKFVNKSGVFELMWVRRPAFENNCNLM